MALDLTTPNKVLVFPALVNSVSKKESDTLFDTAHATDCGDPEYLAGVEIATRACTFIPEGTKVSPKEIRKHRLGGPVQLKTNVSSNLVIAAIEGEVRITMELSGKPAVRIIPEGNMFIYRSSKPANVVIFGNPDVNPFVCIISFFTDDEVRNTFKQEPVIDVTAATNYVEKLFRQAKSLKLTSPKEVAIDTDKMNEYLSGYNIDEFVGSALMMLSNYMCSASGQRECPELKTLTSARPFVPLVFPDNTCFRLIRDEEAPKTLHWIIKTIERAVHVPQFVSGVLRGGSLDQLKSLLPPDLEIRFGNSVDPITAATLLLFAYAARAQAIHDSSVQQDQAKKRFVGPVFIPKLKRSGLYYKFPGFDWLLDCVYWFERFSKLPGTAATDTKVLKNVYDVKSIVKRSSKKQKKQPKRKEDNDNEEEEEEDDSESIHGDDEEEEEEDDDDDDEDSAIVDADDASDLGSLDRRNESKLQRASKSNDKTFVPESDSEEEESDSSPKKRTKKHKEDEEKKKKKEAERKAAEEKKKREEAKKKEDDERKAVEEKKKREEAAKKKEDDERKAAEEKKKREEAKKKEDDERKAAEEKKKREETAKQKEEEKKKREEAAKKKEDDERKAAEEKKKREEAAKKEEEEKKKREEALKQKEEEEEKKQREDALTEKRKREEKEEESAEERKRKRDDEEQVQAEIKELQEQTQHDQMMQMEEVEELMTPPMKFEEWRDYDQGKTIEYLNSIQKWQTLSATKVVKSAMEELKVAGGDHVILIAWNHPFANYGSHAAFRQTTVGNWKATIEKDVNLSPLGSKPSHLWMTQDLSLFVNPLMLHGQPITRIAPFMYSLEKPGSAIKFHSIKLHCLPQGFENVIFYVGDKGTLSWINDSVLTSFRTDILYTVIFNLP